MPAGLGVKMLDGDRVRLSWSAPADSPDDVSGYRIYRRAVADASASPRFGFADAIVLHTGSTGTRYVDLTAEEGRMYAYAVAAYRPSMGNRPQPRRRTQPTRNPGSHIRNAGIPKPPYQRTGADCAARPVCPREAETMKPQQAQEQPNHRPKPSHRPARRTNADMRRRDSSPSSGDRADRHQCRLRATLWAQRTTGPRRYRRLSDPDRPHLANAHRHRKRRGGQGRRPSPGNGNAARTTQLCRTQMAQPPVNRHRSRDPVKEAPQ